MNATLPIPQTAPSALPRPAEDAFVTPAELRGHMAPLDGVRGVAVLMVMALHFIGNSTPTNQIERIIGYVVGHGILGVDLFFLLSGFLITGILFDTRFSNNFFRNFYARRTLRIFPLYYGTIAATLLVARWVPDSAALGGIRDDQAWLWLYGANILHAVRGEWSLSYLNHFWSLAIEEHFYFFWPILIWTLRRHPRCLMWTSLGIGIASRFAEVALTRQNEMIGMLTPLHLQGIAFGSFLALFARSPRGLERLREWTPRVAVALVTILAGSFVLHRLTEAGQSFLGPLRESLFVLLLACILVRALTAPAGSPVIRFFGSRALTSVGTYSYGLYVFHHFISYGFISYGTEFVVAEWTKSHAAAVAALALGGSAASFLVAWLSYHIFEKRFLLLRRHFSA